MGRKPTPPIPILKIECLSTGIDPTAVDDFGDAVIAQPNAKPPAIQDAQAEIDRRKRKAVADQLLALQLLGLVPMTDSALQRQAQARADSALPVAKAKPQAIVHSNGQAFALAFPKINKPFRRV